MTLTPVTLREARAFVAQHHRHHRAPAGGIFAIAASEADKVLGVVIVGRPVARALQVGGYVAEVTRLCVLPGARNACSMLYAAAWRAARSMGYRRMVTYVLDTETGASVKAAGWKLIAETSGGSWNCPSRPRVDTHPTQPKLRFEVAA